NLRLLAPSEIQQLMSLAPEAAPGLQKMTSSFANKLSARLQTRARDDFNGFNFFGNSNRNNNNIAAQDRVIISQEPIPDSR
ncbi:hypothetical protein, partial [Pseudomonas aeruginosa]|uniref:hypothetical protein n=1 Tax=Pseudomonas aeruginosa TaxID=287 RepID=UPI001968FECB